MHTPPTHSVEDRRTQQAIAVECASTLDELDALQADWDRLTDASAAPNVFTTFAWYRAWIARRIEEAGPGSLEPFVLVARQNGAVTGRLGVRVRKIEFLTYHADYNELVVGSDVPALTAAVLDALARSTHEWDLLDLMDLRDNAAQSAVLQTAAARTGLAFRAFAEPDRCLYMPIHAPWTETKTRKHLRFARRASLAFKEREHEGFRARVVDQPHREPELLRRIIAVEAQKRVDGKISLPIVGRYHDVFQALVDTLGPRGGIAIVVVEQNERLIAWRWLYRCGSKLWDYLTAYDHAFSELSPGTILLCEAIDYGFRHGCDEFDFLRGTDAYKQRWTSTFRTNRRLILWSRHWRSRVAAWALLRQRAHYAVTDKTSNHAAQAGGQKAAIALEQKGKNLA